MPKILMPILKVHNIKILMTYFMKLNNINKFNAGIF